MNNEPVAWMSKHDNHILTTNKLWIKETEDAGVDNWIPLYTHPAKTLTDEEYEKLMQQWDYWRKQIADGDKSSAPRDWFECVIELFLEQY